MQDYLRLTSDKTPANAKTLMGNVVTRKSLDSELATGHRVLLRMLGDGTSKIRSALETKSFIYLP